MEVLGIGWSEIQPPILICVRRHTWCYFSLFWAYLSADCSQLHLVPNPQYLMNRLFKFTCPFCQQGCSWHFRSQGGRTYHIRTCHTNYNNITPPLSPEPIPSASEPVSPSDGLNLPNQDPLEDPNIPQPLSPTSPTQPKKIYHPWLTGEDFSTSIHSWIFNYNLQEGLAMPSYLRELPWIPDPILTLMTGIRLMKRSNF